LLVDDWLGLYVVLPVFAHSLHSQGSQKRSLPVSSATRNFELGVPTSTSA
jgi:hypothetical protein